jgi:mono/diheme cytochrome c family protein
MRRIALVSLLALAATFLNGISIRAAKAATLNADQTDGRRLYNQHCGVCHTKPTILSPYYGPALSKEIVNNNEDALREFIQNGTDRMPGFQYTLAPRQIDSIVHYLMTVPPPPEAATPAPKPAARGNERELD